mgnify:CR=1 FL=1
MGFFKNMFDEAGRKTGSAIGNKLFPKSTDYIRLGKLGDDDAEERKEAELEAQQERLEMEQQTMVMESLLKLKFDTKDIEHNIMVLTQISAIIDSLPAHIYRSDLEQKIYKMAKSMMQSGITLSKTMDPKNPMITYFENKF